MRKLKISCARSDKFRDRTLLAAVHQTISSIPKEELNVWPQFIGLDGKVIDVKTVRMSINTVCQALNLNASTRFNKENNELRVIVFEDQ